MAEPETPPISAESAIETCASPPRSRPVITEARLRSRSVMPDLFMKLPAMMKSGMASSAKFCVCETVTWMGMVKRQLGMLEEEQRAGDADREGDRHPHQHKNEEGDGDDQHRGAASLKRGLLRKRPSARRASRNLRTVVISSSAAPTGRLIVTQE